MEKITYGAPRYMDWVAQIKAGGATVRVHFTGGALTVYGITPAEYTTTDPFIQKVIEKSSYFKEGRITLLRRATISDTTKPTKQKITKVQTQSAPQPHPSHDKGDGTPAGQSEEPVAEMRQETDTPTSPATKAEAVAGDHEDVSEEFIEVAVSCLQDAQAYLQEHFNIPSYKVRTYEAAQRAAAKHGVKFVGAKFDTINDGEKAGDETVEEE